MEQITQSIIDFLSAHLNNQLAVFVIAMVPVIEICGAIPLGIAVFNLHWSTVLIISIIGNLFPIPFILLFLKYVMNFMRRFKFFDKFVAWLESRVEKNKDEILRYEFWGLFLYVAIPLPLTGVWTGALVASVVEMPFWRAFLSISLGVIVTAVCVTLAVTGVVSAFNIFLNQ